MFKMPSRIDFYSSNIDKIEKAFRLLESQVPEPKLAAVYGRETYRYTEQSIQQAMILKLARYVSTLRASLLLLENGYLQEQGALQRVLDELGDDITFLSLSHARGPNKLCRKFLNVFWQEEFEEDVEPINNSKARYQIPRPEIRNFIANIEGQPDPQIAIKAGNSLSQTYSGFVHAAAPHIMEMCVEPGARFALAGVFAPSLLQDHIDDFWNYIYRGFLSAQFVALAFNDNDTAAHIRASTEDFESKSGTTFMKDAKRDTTG